MKRAIYIFASLSLMLLSFGSPSYAIPPARIPATGQTSCYDSEGTAIPCAGTGQDGETRTGVAWPVPRFTDNGNGTVTDNLTGLVWLKNANCFGAQNWTSALSSASSLASGQCGLSDGSTVGQWRLPNVNELESLIDDQRISPALPVGHPFNGIQPLYWSSSSFGSDHLYAWCVIITSGGVFYYIKTNSYYIWPVRAGQ